MTEKEFSTRIAAAGGTAYIVGGWVRDWLRGKAPHDKDYVVVGISKDNFINIFRDAKLIGNSFPVFLLEIHGVKCEVAFARRETKNGTGYRGFDISSAGVTIEEDLYRRDTTVNSMAVNLLTGELVDPYGGKKDIEKHLLRPVSEHFSEDPVRALRAARQGAQLDYLVSDELIAAMQQCKEELKLEPAERIFGELKKALTAPKPSNFFRILQRAGLLNDLFPEIYALIGKSQPLEFHPEGDAFEHTMNLTDKVAAMTDNPVVVFCGLVHDIGKGVTPREMLPHHYDHEKTGLQVLAEWNRRAKFPRAWVRSAALVIEEHMRAPLLKKAGKITELILLLDKMKKYILPEDFCKIIMADHGSLPIYLEKYHDLKNKIMEVNGAMVPDNLSGNQIGEWIAHRRANICAKWLKEWNTP